MTAELARVEQIIDASGQGIAIEARLPVGVRPRQLKARTLLIGMTLAMLAGRDALLTNVHAALRGLPDTDQRRLGVIVPCKHAEHELTYRQLEYTYRLITKTLAKDEPDGRPSAALSDALDRLLEASVTVLGEPASSSYAVDWTDHETWSRPPPAHADVLSAGQQLSQPEVEQPDPQTATDDHERHADDEHHAHDEHRRRDREAAWGHRNTNHPGKSERFYGYYLQAVTAVRDEHGPEVPELVRRIQLASCDHDPPAALLPTLRRMHDSAIKMGDLLADSGYSYRVAETWRSHSARSARS